MRVLTNVLVVLAAVCLLLGTLVALVGRTKLYVMTSGIIPFWAPETWWRGAVGLLLFAITFMLMERRSLS